ncbi:hypothetical protein F8388_019882 [Cannabis sativa]|uniref:DUF1985 domain-containing protein n=1 Tax=Cannabis sativa TaxID=3483 RepID=A0A7J6H4R9_CANSA|nr:hypothetical protein F8388_019882 [Cannabis sativa]
MVRTRSSMSPSPEVSGLKKKVEKIEEVLKNMVGSGSKVVESDKEKKNKNLSISKRSGVSEASPDDRRSKKLKSVVEDEDDFDSKCDEAPIVLPKKLKVWDFYLKPEDRFCGKIIYWFDVGVIAEIKGRLTTKQLTMFQESCFGHFLDLKECNMQSQVIHTALCREVHQANVKEICFDFGNSKTRFGLGEFAIISGLLCKGDSSMGKYIGRGDTFVDKYFSDMTINYAAVKQRFLNSIFKDMCLLLECFPWGKVGYDATLYSLRTVLKEKNKKKVVDETKAEKNQKLDIVGFEFSYGSESDDDFEDVRQPRVDVDKTGSSRVEKKATISLAVLDELKDSVLGLVVRQVGLECVLKEFHKEVDEKFALLEENLKGYIDRKGREDLTFYFDTKFSELKDLIKDSIANVVPQLTVKRDAEDASDVKDGEDCVGGDGDVYKVWKLKNISEMSVKEVDSQDFAGLSSLEKDMPNFDILGSLLGQNETVAMVED